MINYRQQIDELKSKALQFTIGLIVISIFVFVGLSTSIYSVKKLNSLPSFFRGITPLGTPPPPPPPGGSTPIEEWILACTNETLGNETVIYDGTTSIGFNCQPTGDVCKTSICLTNGTCDVIFSNSTFNCSTNSDCGNGMQCEDCICIEQTPCMIDADCGEIIWTTCVESTCVDGFCQQNRTAGSTCVTDEGCAPGWICRNCTCVVIPPEICTVDSDCGTIEWSTCFENVCDTGSCFSRLTGGSTCVTDGECGEGMECQNCTCQERFICDDASDCGEIDWTTCLEYQCIDNSCVQNFTAGSTCASSESCLEGFQCKNCTCEIEEERCQIDADCPILNFTNCLTNICNDTFCNPVLIEGNECSDSSFCGSSEFCNNLCQCQELGTFTIVQSGSFTVGGATTFSVDYGLFASGDVRIFTYNSGSNTASVTTSISSVGSVINVGNRPPASYFFSVSVINDPFDNGVVTLGTLGLSTGGNLNWFTGGGGTFTSGNQAGFYKTSVTWLVA